jgi:hypothetical protein
VSLPELTTDTWVTVEVTGQARTVSHCVLIMLPYAAPTGASRGRRYRIELHGGPAMARVVLSVHGQAALRPPDAMPLTDGQSVKLRLRALPNRRPRQIPGDLRWALEAAGTTLDQLGTPATQHLLLMVAEAAEPSIRAQRVRAAVEAACGHGSSS